MKKMLAFILIVSISFPALALSPPSLKEAPEFVVDEARFMPGGKVKLSLLIQYIEQTFPIQDRFLALYRLHNLYKRNSEDTLYRDMYDIIGIVTVASKQISKGYTGYTDETRRWEAQMKAAETLGSWFSQLDSRLILHSPSRWREHELTVIQTWLKDISPEGWGILRSLLDKNDWKNITENPVAERNITINKQPGAGHKIKVLNKAYAEKERDYTKTMAHAWAETISRKYPAGLRELFFIVYNCWLHTRGRPSSMPLTDESVKTILKTYRTRFNKLRDRFIFLTEFEIYNMAEKIGGPDVLKEVLDVGVFEENIYEDIASADTLITAVNDHIDTDTVHADAILAELKRQKQIAIQNRRAQRAQGNGLWNALMYKIEYAKLLLQRRRARKARERSK